MSNKRNSFEDDFRSSKLFKTLSESGGNVANVIADGIGKATNAIDSAVNGVVGGASGNAQKGKGTPNTNYNPSAGNTPGNNPAGTGQNSGNQYGRGQWNGQVNANKGTAPNGGTPNNVPPGVNYNYNYNYKAQTNTSSTAPGRKGYKAPPPSQYRQPSKAYAPPVKKGNVPPANGEYMMVREPSTAKFWLTGIAAVLYALFGKLYTPMHFVIFVIILIGVFVASSFLFKGKKKYVPVPKEEPKPEPVSKTGNPEVDKIIADGHDYILKMRKANDAIPDDKLSESIDRMEKASKGIFDYISENPEKAPQIRKFMNYYLPTTMKLLTSYQKLDSQTVKGENITKTMTDIERMVYTIAGAFEKQLDSLFGDEAMDISTDISVFESMLKQEGYIGDEDATSQTDDGEIKLNI